MLFAIFWRVLLGSEQYQKPIDSYYQMYHYIVYNWRVRFNKNIKGEERKGGSSF